MLICHLLLCLLVTVRGLMAHCLVTLIITVKVHKTGEYKRNHTFFVAGMFGISLIFSCNPRYQDHFESGQEALCTWMGGEGVFVGV